MFKAIATFFNIITTLFNTVDVIAKVGEDYAYQFKAESELLLSQKRVLLNAQIALANEAATA